MRGAARIWPCHTRNHTRNYTGTACSQASPMSRQPLLKVYGHVYPIDDALYAAKRGGRMRFMLYRGPDIDPEPVLPKAAIAS